LELNTDVKTRREEGSVENAQGKSPGCMLYVTTDILRYDAKDIAKIPTLVNRAEWRILPIKDAEPGLPGLVGGHRNRSVVRLFG